MDHELQLIIGLTGAIGVAWLGGLAAHALRQSPIVGYLVAGMIIGPFTPGFSANHDQIVLLAGIGVIFLMFALGIEFSLKELARLRGPAVGGTLAQLALVMAAGIGLGALVGWPFAARLFFGGIIAVSSTMVIIKTLMNRGEIESNHGRLLLAMLIVQDLAVVALVLLLPQLAAAGGANGSVLVLALIKAAAFIAVTLLLGSRVVPLIMRRVEQLQSAELFLLTAVALALCAASFSAWLGLSPALGAFVAGLMLTETEFDHRIMSEIIPMRDLFATLFFVSVGMLIDLSFLVHNLLAVLGIAVFIMVVKAVATALALSPFRMGAKTTCFTALGMISIGEFNFLLAQAGLNAHAIGQELYNLILSSALVTIVLTPAAFYFAPRLARLLQYVPGLTRLLAPTVATPVPVAGLANHAVVVGYGRVGKRMARGLRQAGLPIVVIEQELRLVNELQQKGITAIYGDGTYATVLAAAGPATARVIVITLPDFGATRAAVHRARTASPECLIIARAQRAEDDVKLREAGASAVVVPEIAGALMLLEETLLLLGLPHSHIFTGPGILHVSLPRSELEAL